VENGRIDGSQLPPEWPAGVVAPGEARAGAADWLAPGPDVDGRLRLDEGAPERCAACTPVPAGSGAGVWDVVAGSTALPSPGNGGGPDSGAATGAVDPRALAPTDTEGGATLVPADTDVGGRTGGALAPTDTEGGATLAPTDTDVGGRTGGALAPTDTEVGATFAPTDTDVGGRTGGALAPTDTEVGATLVPTEADAGAVGGSTADGDGRPTEVVAFVTTDGDGDAVTTFAVTLIGTDVVTTGAAGATLVLVAGVLVAGVLVAGADAAVVGDVPVTATTLVGGGTTGTAPTNDAALEPLAHMAVAHVLAHTTPHHFDAMGSYLPTVRATETVSPQGRKVVRSIAGLTCAQRKDRRYRRAFDDHGNARRHNQTWRRGRGPTATIVKRERVNHDGVRVSAREAQPRRAG